MSKTKSQKTKQKSQNNKRLTPAQIDNIKRVSGFFLIITGIYLAVSFSSFFFDIFNSYSDESIKDMSIGRIFFDSNVHIHNLGGKLGAYLSYIILKDSFGLGSIFLLVFLIAWGINLAMNKHVFQLLRLFTQMLITCLLASLLIGLILRTEPYVILAGYFGFQINTWLFHVIGKPGAALVVVFLIFSATQIKFGFPLRTITWLYHKINNAIQAHREKMTRLRAMKEAQRKQEEAEAAARAEYETEEQEEMSSVNHIESVPNDIEASETNNVESFNEEDTGIPGFNTPEISEEEDISLNQASHDSTINEVNATTDMGHETYVEAETMVETPANPIVPNTQETISATDSTAQENASESDMSLGLDILPNVEEEKSESEKQSEETEEEKGLELETQAIIEEQQINSAREQNRGSLDTNFDPKLDLPRYQLPPIDLLKDYGNGSINVERDELQANKNRIVDTLNNYGIKIDKIRATIGPTVTLYEIIPAPGVRISKIKNLEDDIALSLSALGIRIIAPIPGKGTIGIEVPNQKPDMVSMKSVIASKKFQESEMALPLALGKTISNETFIIDLAKMPHLLMAGATGQGKSVGINAILASLLYKKHPAELKFVLVDPKKVELSLFSKIERHYLAKLPDAEEAIITDTTKVVNTLNSLCIEMDNRYDLLKAALCRNLKEYNEKFVNRKLNPLDGHRFLPYIVLVVDEFADLIMTAGKEVEAPIARLAQLARAIGIHLIIATQRPSTNIITGIIKANFPARISFRVISSIDSRTILDSTGANNLIGKGDMLLSTGSDLTRIQCAFIDTPEVEEITGYIGAQQGYTDAFILPEYTGADNESGAQDMDLADRDVLFEDAARIIVQTQQGSTSMLQRKLKLGYNRAGRIVDQLEAAGIIGPFEGSKAREVIVKTEAELEQVLDNL